MLYEASAEYVGCELLSREEECDLVLRFRVLGDRGAVDELVLHNMRLVEHIVGRVMCKFKLLMVTKRDLIQEGALGLIRAVETFDPFSFGTRFSTHAGYWIFCFVQRCLYECDNGVLSVPEYIFNLREVYCKHPEWWGLSDEVVGGFLGTNGGKVGCLRGLLNLSRVDRYTGDGLDRLDVVGGGVDLCVDREREYEALVFGLEGLDDLSRWVVERHFGLCECDFDGVVRGDRSWVALGGLNSISRDCGGLLSKHQVRKVLERSLCVVQGRVIEWFEVFEGVSRGVRVEGVRGFSFVNGRLLDEVS